MSGLYDLRFRLDGGGGMCYNRDVRDIGNSSFVLSIKRRFFLPPAGG